jgi:hypothetical protein
MKAPIKTLLKPLSLALFVAATLPTQSAYIRTSPPSDAIPTTSPSPHFCKAIGGKKLEAGFSLIHTSDGGYVIAGYTTSFGAGYRDVYVVKLDANGNLQWTKTIGGKDDDGASPSFRPPMAATPSPATPPPSAQEVRMSMSSSWMPMVTSYGSKPSAENTQTRATPSFRPPMAATLSPATLNPLAQEKRMSMSSSWMPMVTSYGPKPSAEKTTIGVSPSFRPPMAAMPSPASPAPSAQEIRMSMSSSWMPAVTSNGPKPSADQRMTGDSPSFRPPMAATPSPASPAPSAQEIRMSMSSSWMPMVTSNGPKPSAEKTMTRASPSFRPPMAAMPSPAPPNPSAQDSWMSMSSSWMPMVTSNGPKPSADQRLRRATPSFRPPMAATPSPATPDPSAQEKLISMSSSWTRMVTPAAPSARPPR